MIILLYILFLLLFIMVFLLCSPLRIVVNSQTDTFSLRWKGIVCVNFLFIRKQPFLSIQFLGFSRNYNLYQFGQKDEKKKQPKSKRSKKRSKLTFSKMRRLVQSFTVRSLYINLDTDDFIVNGYLVPVFQALNGHNKSFKINYIGRNEIRLIVENKLYRLIKAYLF